MDPPPSTRTFRSKPPKPSTRPSPTPSWPLVGAIKCTAPWSGQWVNKCNGGVNERGGGSPHERGFLFLGPTRNLACTRWVNYGGGESEAVGGGFGTPFHQLITPYFIGLSHLPPQPQWMSVDINKFNTKFVHHLDSNVQLVQHRDSFSYSTQMSNYSFFCMFIIPIFWSFSHHCMLVDQNLTLTHIRLCFSWFNLVSSSALKLVLSNTTSSCYTTFPWIGEGKEIGPFIWYGTPCLRPPVYDTSGVRVLEGRVKWGASQILWKARGFSPLPIVPL